MRAFPLAMLLLAIGPAAAAGGLSPDAGQVQSALGFLRSQQTGSGAIGDDSVNAWVVVAIASVGEDPGSWTAAGSGRTPLDALASATPRLRLATDFERQLLAVASAGRDPHAFGGVDLVAAVQGFHDGTQYGSASAINDDAFAILSLRAAGVAADDGRLASSAAFLRAHQGVDGGWSHAVGQPSDVDDTAAVLRAFGALGIQASDPDVQEAFAFLRAQQLPDGGFSSIVHGGTVSNTASDAWVIQAIEGLGGDADGPEWTAPSGSNVLDNLLTLQQADGSFRWDGVQRVGPAWMTAYAIPAMLA